MRIEKKWKVYHFDWQLQHRAIVRYWVGWVPEPQSTYLKNQQPRHLRPMFRRYWWMVCGGPRVFWPAAAAVADHRCASSLPTSRCRCLPAVSTLVRRLCWCLAPATMARPSSCLDLPAINFAINLTLNSTPTKTTTNLQKNKQPKKSNNHFLHI